MNTNKKMGRPSKYSDEIADLICNRIALGESLRSICESNDSLPEHNTVSSWLVSNTHEYFTTKHARARLAQGDIMDQRILEVADNCTPETANADKVKIGAYQWRAARLAPKVYGDKISSDVKLDVADPVVELLKQLRSSEGNTGAGA